jgi:hypothetical protein
MCPVFDSNNNYCRVTPEDHNARRDNSEVEYRCKDSSNYNSCGNYEAYQRGEYKIRR